MTLLALCLACAPAQPPPERPESRKLPEPAAAPEPAPVPEPEPEPEPPVLTQTPPPEGWVDLARVIPGVRLDIRYHTANNFTGAPLPGYGTPGAWLQAQPAQDLALVQADLKERGYSLLIHDAYRPLRGTLAMVAWAKRTDQVYLLDDGYIARRSGHNKGNTIDLTLVKLDGSPVDMGTPWDTLDERSHTRNASGQALENRLLLRAAMHAHGWRNYSKEWWHYSYKMDGKLPHRDVPYACFEAQEGAWQAPAGWSEPGYIMPAEVSVPEPLPEACLGAR